MIWLVVAAFLAVLLLWFKLCDIQGDTTFQWQMQKELLWELQVIRKQLESEAESKRAANKAMSEMFYLKEVK